jgi:hypothetical protein
MELKKMKAIIRTENAGVHFGTVVTRKGSEVILDNSIRLWQWRWLWLWLGQWLGAIMAKIREFCEKWLR